MPDTTKHRLPRSDQVPRRACRRTSDSRKPASSPCRPGAGNGRSCCTARSPPCRGRDASGTVGSVGRSAVISPGRRFLRAASVLCWSLSTARMVNGSPSATPTTRPIDPGNSGHIWLVESARPLTWAVKGKVYCRPLGTARDRRLEPVAAIALTPTSLHQRSY